MSKRSDRSLYKSCSSKGLGWRRSLGRGNLQTTMNYHRTQFSGVQNKNKDDQSLNQNALVFRPALSALKFSGATCLGSEKCPNNRTHLYYSSSFMTPLPPIGSGRYSHNRRLASGSFNSRIPRSQTNEVIHPQPMRILGYREYDLS
ncbi:hypothetical protein ElyMa_001234300 [Elysia marginata]|uniref:Uncharacterized protein n=1 Tax=Elysia marginata TaxID=1093978 RepID=A0AAV4ICU5_9GAST|nr:hypothetical protein ElyMa_001234300 [Elysia marginata]